MSSIQYINNNTINNTLIQDQSMISNNTTFLGKNDLNNSSILERTFLKENIR